MAEKNLIKILMGEKKPEDFSEIEVKRVDNGWVVGLQKESIRFLFIISEWRHVVAFLEKGELNA